MTTINMKNHIKMLLITAMVIGPCLLYSQPNEKIELQFNLANKKTFFQGENIVLDAIISNRSNQDIAICNYYTWITYSITYNKNARELEDLAPKDYPRYKAVSAHRYNTKPSEFDASQGCAFTLFDNIFIGPQGKFHYSVPINFCFDNHHCNGGSIPFPLPEGKYEFTLKISPSSGGLLVKTFVFEVISAKTEEAELLKKLKEVFASYNSQSIIDFYNTCSNQTIKDKVIISIRKFTEFDNEIFTFWISNIANISDEALLIYELHELVKLFSFNDQALNNYNTSRMEVYKKVFLNLKTRNPEITTAFLAMINSWNLYKESYEGFQKIPDVQIRSLRE